LLLLLLLSATMVACAREGPMCRLSVCAADLSLHWCWWLVVVEV
jgi:hypothetical protein